MNDTRPFPYDFKERIVSEQECEICSIYHRDFVEELRNIKVHANLSEYSGNMVHYVISSRSVEAASEMIKLSGMWISCSHILYNKAFNSFIPPFQITDLLLLPQIFILPP